MKRWMVASSVVDTDSGQVVAFSDQCVFTEISTVTDAQRDAIYKIVREAFEKMVKLIEPREQA